MFNRMIVVCFCVYATHLELKLLAQNHDDNGHENSTADIDFTEVNAEKEKFKNWLITTDPDLLQTPTFTFFSNKKDLYDLSTKNEWSTFSTLLSWFCTKPLAEFLEVDSQRLWNSQSL